MMLHTNHQEPGRKVDFKEATDILFAHPGHADLAVSLGVSIPSIRQARLGPDAKAFRHPPENWRKSVIRLAEKRIMEQRRLIEELRREVNT